MKNKFSTHQAIVQSYEEKESEPRLHLGCSEIGRQCERSLWYSFRWADSKKLDGRVLRLFQTGHLSEPRFINDLENIGAEVHAVNPDTGKQFNFAMFGGHFSGSLDAIAKGIPENKKLYIVCEFKTHSAKSFALLKKDGVELSKPEHYAQMQCYMGFSGLYAAIYLAVNKDTDELYSEYIIFEEAVFEWAKDRASKIIFGDIPTRISNDKMSDECKYCEFSSICHGEKVAKKTCRTCIFSEPTQRGSWFCHKNDRNLYNNEQSIGCRSHLFKKEFINFAVLESTNDNYSVYKIDDDTSFVNCSEEVAIDLPAIKALDLPVFYSKEISLAPISFLKNNVINESKKFFDGIYKMIDEAKK